MFIFKFMGIRIVCFIFVCFLLYYVCYVHVFVSATNTAVVTCYWRAGPLFFALNQTIAGRAPWGCGITDGGDATTCLRWLRADDDEVIFDLFWAGWGFTGAHDARPAVYSRVEPSTLIPNAVATWTSASSARTGYRQRSSWSSAAVVSYSGGWLGRSVHSPYSPKAPRTRSTNVAVIATAASNLYRVCLG